MEAATEDVARRGALAEPDHAFDRDFNELESIGRHGPKCNEIAAGTGVTRG
jgi:hypothetical protein